MATASTIVISANSAPEFAVSALAEEAAARASKVLQENHDKNDIIFTDFGLHSKSMPIATESGLGVYIKARLSK